MPRRPVPKPRSTAHHLDPAPLERRAQAWHALAAMRATCQNPALQLFAAVDAQEHELADAQVPPHLLRPQPSRMD